MNKQSSRKLNNNALFGAHSQSSDDPVIITPRHVGFYRPTNVWIDSSAASLARLLAAQSTGSLANIDVTVHYASVNVAEQKVFLDFVAQWNSFAKVVNKTLEEQNAKYSSTTVTAAEIDELRRTSWRLSGLNTINDVIFIDDNSNESYFDVCRDLIVSLASSTAKLHKKATLTLLSDLELTNDEVFTLNTVSRALTGFLVTGDHNVTNDNLSDYASRYSVVSGYDVWFQKLQDLPRRILAARNNLAIPEDHGIDLAKVAKAATKAKKK